MPAQIHPNALKPGSGRGGSSFKRAASQASMSLGSFRKPIAQQRNERGLRRTVDVAPTDSKHAGKATWRLYERVAVAGCLWEGMVLIPYLVGMGERYSPATLAVALAFDAFYAVDLALKARKQWSDRALDAAGEDESRCVRALYVASRLWVEIVACLPLGLTVGAAVDGAINGPTFAAFRLNKVLRARRLLLHMRRAKNNIRYNWDVMDVGFILVLQLWLQHIFALVWHAASSTQPGGWVRRYDGAWYDAASVAPTTLELYLRAFYWATVTITSVGFGDIVPKTPLEYLISILLMLLGQVLNALLFAYMAMYASNVDKMGERFGQQARQTMLFCRYQQLPAALTQRVLAYLKYKWLRTHGLNERKVLAELPPKLSQDVNLELYKDLIEAVPLFRGVEKGFIKAIVKYTFPEFFMPSEHVVRKGAVGKEMFFIYRGKCTVLANDNKSPLFTLKQGSFFGEIALVLNERRTASVIAASFCDILILRKGDLFRVIRDYPNVAIRLAEYAKQRLLERSRAQEAQKGFESLIDSLGELGILNAARAAGRRRCKTGAASGSTTRQKEEEEDARRPSMSGPSGRRSPRSNAEGKKPVYASGTRRRGSGDASATSFARERRDSDANMQCSSIIDFLKANPISTAAKLCNSSLNSSKTNSRVSSAVATPVVRSRRGSHDAGRSRGGRLAGRRHSLGAEGTTRRRGSNPDVAPVPEDSATSGASFKGRNKQRRGSWPGPLRPSAAAMGGDDSRRNSIDGEAGRVEAAAAAAAATVSEAARKLSALVTGRVSPSGSREGSIPRRSPNVDDAAQGAAAAGGTSSFNPSHDASPRRRQRRLSLDSQSSQDSISNETRTARRRGSVGESGGASAAASHGGTPAVSRRGRRDRRGSFEGNLSMIMNWLGDSAGLSLGRRLSVVGADEAAAAGRRDSQSWGGGASVTPPGGGGGAFSLVASADDRLAMNRRCSTTVYTGASDERRSSLALAAAAGFRLPEEDDRDISPETAAIRAAVEQRRAAGSQSPSPDAMRPAAVAAPSPPPALTTRAENSPAARFARLMSQPRGLSCRRNSGSAMSVASGSSDPLAADPVESRADSSCSCAPTSVAGAVPGAREAVVAFNDDSFVPNRAADEGFSDSDDGSNRSSAPSESFHQRSNPSHSRSNSHRRKGETGGADGDVAVDDVGSDDDDDPLPDGGRPGASSPTAGAPSPPASPPDADGFAGVAPLGASPLGRGPSPSPLAPRTLGALAQEEGRSAAPRGAAGRLKALQQDADASQEAETSGGGRSASPHPSNNSPAARAAARRDPAWHQRMGECMRESCLRQLATCATGTTPPGMRRSSEGEASVGAGGGGGFRLSASGSTSPPLVGETETPQIPRRARAASRGAVGFFRSGAVSPPLVSEAETPTMQRRPRRPSRGPGFLFRNDRDGGSPGGSGTFDADGRASASPTMFRRLRASSRGPGEDRWRAARDAMALGSIQHAASVDGGGGGASGASRPVMDELSPRYSSREVKETLKSAAGGGGGGPSSSSPTAGGSPAPPPRRPCGARTPTSPCESSGGPTPQPLRRAQVEAPSAEDLEAASAQLATSTAAQAGVTSRRNKDNCLMASAGDAEPSSTVASLRGSHRNDGGGGGGGGSSRGRNPLRRVDSHAKVPDGTGVRGGAVTVEEKRGGISRRDRRWRRLTELQIAWDAVLVLLVFVDIVTLPLSVCGFVASLGPEWLVFWATTEALFAIDLLKRLMPLRPETADFDASPWRRSVDWSYLKSAQCALDVLSLLPVDFVALAVVGGADRGAAQVVAVCRLGRVLRFEKLRRQFRQWQSSLLLMGDRLGFAKYFGFILLLSHWVGCFWFLLGSSCELVAFGTDVTPCGWVDAEQQASTLPLGHYSVGVPMEPLAASPTAWREWYLKSLYWSVKTMTTVGYGDIVPSANAEILFSICVMFGGHVVLAFIFGLIASYVISFDMTAHVFREKLTQFNEFMSYRKLTGPTRERVREYCNHVWNETCGVDEEVVMRNLPHSIREDLMWHLYHELLHSVPLFREAERGFIQLLANRMRSHMYPPGEMVVQAGEIGREMFFIETGVCAVMGTGEMKERVVARLGHGQFFGEVALLFSVKRTASVKTRTYCKLLSLCKSDLADVMKDYKAEAQTIKTMARQRMKEYQESTAKDDSSKVVAASAAVENLKAAERAAGRTSPPDGGGVVDHGPPTPPPSPPWWEEVVREVPADLTC